MSMLNSGSEGVMCFYCICCKSLRAASMFSRRVYVLMSNLYDVVFGFDICLLWLFCCFKLNFLLFYCLSIFLVFLRLFRSYKFRKNALYARSFGIILCLFDICLINLYILFVFLCFVYVYMIFGCVVLFMFMLFLLIILFTIFFVFVGFSSA